VRRRRKRRGIPRITITDMQSLTLIGVSSRSTAFPLYVCLSWRLHPGADRPLALLGNEGFRLGHALRRAYHSAVSLSRASKTSWGGLIGIALVTFFTQPACRYCRATFLQQTRFRLQRRLGVCNNKVHWIGSTVGRTTTLVWDPHGVCDRGACKRLPAAE
jgi:hypothetical protein